MTYKHKKHYKLSLKHRKAISEGLHRYYNNKHYKKKRKRKISNTTYANYYGGYFPYYSKLPRFKGFKRY